MADCQDTEKKIIEAAKLVFMEKGLDGTKMSDIAERAEISRTALNYYYRTKENLFYEIIGQVFDILLPKIENVSALDGDVPTKVEAVVDIYDNMLRQNEYMPRFVFAEIQRNPQLIHDFVEHNQKARLYLKALTQLMNNGKKPNEEPRFSKEHLITTFFGLVFVPYLLEPLLAMYRMPDEAGRRMFLDEHKVIVKRMLNAYFDK